MTDIVNNIADFSPITLEEMDRVRLMNRNDTKYIFHAGLLPAILAQARKNYRVLEISETRLFRYDSLYYDTGDLVFYRDHHNGMRPRFKVRFREYLDTGAVYLEIKRKTSKGRTRKSRQKADSMETTLSTVSLEYIAQRIPEGTPELYPAVSTLFKRMTLVSRNEDERITIDTDLSFSLGETHKKLPNLVICEVKRDGSAGVSTFMRLLKEHYIYPGNMSKYCLGTVLLKQGIKVNRFKENLLRIKQLENEYTTYTAAG
jgi:hypothetical protein